MSDQKWHEFLTDNKFADAAASDREWCEPLYRQMFPSMTENGLCEPQPFNTEEQRIGIDRVVLLQNGKSVTVDEKWRRSVVQKDFLAELWSNKEKTVRGWFQTFIKDDRCPNYILYTCYPLGGKVILINLEWLKQMLPYLRKRWYRNAESENDGFSFVEAKSGATNLGIPFQEITDVFGENSIQVYSPPRKTPLVQPEDAA